MSNSSQNCGIMWCLHVCAYQKCYLFSDFVDDFVKTFVNLSFKGACKMWKDVLLWVDVYSKTSIKRTLNIKLIEERIEKVAQLVRKVSNLCHEFHAILTIWAIYSTYSIYSIIWYLRVCFIAFLLYLELRPEQKDVMFPIASLPNIRN